MDNYGGSADQLVNSNLQRTETNLALIPKGGKLHTTENQATGH